MNFKWAMQEKIDAGMNSDEAYNATKDSYAAAWDDFDDFTKVLRKNDCDCREICNCTCDCDCECKTPAIEGSRGVAELVSDRYS